MKTIKHNLARLLMLALLTSMIVLPASRVMAQTGTKTRVVDHLLTPSGGPRRGKVTFILTRKASSPGGIIPVGGTVSASLDESGRFDIWLYPSASLNPKTYYQVWFVDTNGSQELIGIYDIPASTSVVTLASYRVTDTNLAAQYTFASATDVGALTTAVSNATLTILNGVARHNGRVQVYRSASGTFEDSRIADTNSGPVSVAADLSVTGNTTTAGNNTVTGTSTSGAATINGTATVNGNITANNLGTMAAQSAASVAITGGTLTNVTCTGCVANVSGSGGVTNNDTTVIEADADGDTVGFVDERIHGVSKRRLNNDGTTDLLGGLTTFTKAGLPSPGNTGRLARVTDDIRGLWMDTGTQWVSLNGSIVDVQLFGAKGDGSTDDSTALAAAMTALPAAGGVLYFTPGKTYRVDTKLVASKSNVLWSGYGATLRFQGANTSRLMTLSGANNTFKGLTFSGNSSQPYGALIYVDDNTENPKFLDCTFRDISVSSHGSVLKNQVYAVDISPYGVTNFAFRNCLFYNLINNNTGNVVGNGFVGGINFTKINLSTNPETDSPMTDAQTVVTNGVVEGCTFDTIKTILNSGLSEDDVSQYDDADAIRASPGVCYGYDSDGEVSPGVPCVLGQGADRLDLNVSNCRFINVSKRAIKYSAMSGLTASNNEVIADKGDYSMTNVMRVYGNSSINGLKIFSPGKKGSLTRSGATVTAHFTNHGLSDGERVSVFGATEQEYNGLVTVASATPDTFTYTIVGTPATPAHGTIRVAKTPRVGLSLFALQNVSISSVVMDAGGSFVQMIDTTSPAPAQRNLIINGFAVDNLDYGGIFTSTNNSPTAYGLTFANGYIGCTGDSARAIETPSAGKEGKIRIYNVEVRNGDVHIQGQDNIIDGLHITIDRAGFTGSAANRSLLELGINGSTNYNIYRNISVNVQSILSTYLNATRTFLILVTGANTTTRSLTIRVPSYLSDVYAHATFFGNDCVVDGVDYWGHGYFELGVQAATDSSVYRNITRLGTGHAVAFIVTNGNGTNLTQQNIVDKRTVP